uniref:Retroviral polymerase SH3-like domain-containing protein n=1 Tax=Phytophthora ramorum TaxID=164328 RepID=H3H9X7_PHYRM
MLHHAKLDKCFWAEAAMTAIYVKNRLPSPKVEHKTPFEIVYKSKPSVKHMRVFGCQTYILTPKEKRRKWDPKARAGLFLGYEEVSKAYRLYDIEAGQVVVSRDVNFDESAFGLSAHTSGEDVDDAALDLDDNDGPRQTSFKQAGKRKSRPTEYIALSLAIQEGKWIHRLLCEILAAANETGPELMIREDNQSCIKMTKNPVNHGRAKHIDIKYHHIRDEVKRGEVKLEYCKTSVMLAEKALVA